MTSLLWPCSACCSPSMEKHADFLSGSSLYCGSLLLDYLVACIFKLMIVVLLQTRKVFPTGFYAAMRYRNVFISLKFIVMCIIIWILLSEMTVLQCFASTLTWYCLGGIHYPRSWRYLLLGHLDENLERSDLIPRTTRNSQSLCAVGLPARRPINLCSFTLKMMREFWLYFILNIYYWFWVILSTVEDCNLEAFWWS